MNTRRDFLKKTLAFGAAAVAARPIGFTSPSLIADKWFDISLAQWSLHRSFFSGESSAMDFARIAKRDFGIGGIEYVNAFYKEGFSLSVADELKMRAEGEGVESLLIMCDGLGLLGDPDEGNRKQTVENHKIWIDAAKRMGCHSIRVNAGSVGSYNEQMKLAADGLSRLADVGQASEINVIVENHGGLSSNGAWLSGVMQNVSHDYCGTLPDFGNFVIDRKTDESYDRYQGTEELMPFAKGVSAKSYNFNDLGEETTIDYSRMLTIVKDAGYRGYVGVEYEGKRMSEPDGVRATKRLLQQLGGR
ncbi:sugar phosphate isomerase/epimerase [Puniceicoccaceae bacterium K14]|nr:sugar phosphate isomerase/epimerase [Puniceicoccaceae bacterium K14]